MISQLDTQHVEAHASWNERGEIDISIVHCLSCFSLMGMNKVDVKLLRDLMETILIGLEDNE